MSQAKHSVQVIDEKLFDLLLARAQDTPRRRVNHNFHPTLADNPHRFLNVMLKGSYFTPHRHKHPPKSESFLVLRGQLAFFVFDDAGQVLDCHILGEGTTRQGIDIGPGIWHTLLVLSDHCICFEVKPGPYEVGTDKEFADWAPQEGDPDCERYLDQLMGHVRQQQ